MKFCFQLCKKSKGICGDLRYFHKCNQFWLVHTTNTFFFYTYTATFSNIQTSNLSDCTDIFFINSSVYDSDKDLRLKPLLGFMKPDRK